MQGSHREWGQRMSQVRTAVAAGLTGILLGTANPAVSAENNALTLPELQKALAAHPDAKWQAADTGASAQIGSPIVTESGVRTGINFGLRDYQGPRRKTQIERARVDEPTPNLPRKWDWRNATVAGVTGDFMSPVRNQGKCGSCVAFATAGSYEGTVAVAAGTPRLDVNVSEQDLFAAIGSCASGSWPSSGMSEVTDRGVPDEACSPYKSGRMGKDGEATDACQDRSARLLQATTDSSYYSPAEIKQALMTGPLQTTMSVYEDFMFYAGGVYKHVTGPQMGGHAITMVGFDDDARFWIAKNSWGATWGEAGYFRISYDDVSGFADDGYGFTVNANEVTMRLDTPAYFSAVQGKVPMEVSVFDEAVESVRWELASADQQWLQGRVFRGNFKFTGIKRSGARIFRGTIDTIPLADGVAGLALEAVANGGGVKGRKVYTRLVIVNQPAVNPGDQAIAITPDFDNSKPIKSRVYFKFDAANLATAQKAPLTHAELVIAGADVPPVRIRFDDPGTEAMFGWRTQMYTDGTYKVFVEGFVGDLQTFKSNELEVRVQNK